MSWKKHMYKNNRGLTLIELIVVAAIMTTLTGLLVPQFMKYVAEKRTTACVENREAVVNICEKIVYSGVPLGQLSSCVSDITNPAVGTYAGVPAEYQEALKSHMECPEHGTMEVTVSGGVITCTCTAHNGGEKGDRVVVSDMVTWSGSEAEVQDPNFDIPSYMAPPEDPPEEEETPSGHTPSGHSSYNDTYWPYPNHKDWQDPSKVVEGSTGSSNPALYITVPSGKFPMRNANGTYAYYVAIDKNSTGKLKIEYMYAASPQLFMNGSNCEGVIPCNGTEYNADSILQAASEYPGLKKTDNDSSHGINEWEFKISTGTIYDNGVHRYIYFHEGTEGDEGYYWLPTADNVAAKGEGTGGINKCGNWYLMKDTDETR